MVRPIVHGPDTPQSVDAFAVDWAHAVEAHAPIAPSAHPYLAAIGRYTNTEPLALGIFAHELVALHRPRAGAAPARLGRLVRLTLGHRSPRCLDRPRDTERALLAFSHSD